MDQDVRPIVVTFGEIMMRLSTPESRRFQQLQSLEVSYAGAEANVAASLANLGVTTQYVTRLPNNELAHGCMRFLRQEGVGTDHVVVGGDRLGLLFYESGAAQRGSKVVYDRAGSSFACLAPEMLDWSRILRDASWFHSTGITPAVSASAAQACEEAFNVATELKLKVSCDLNYRANLWRWGKAAHEIMPVLVDKCDLVFANEEDAAKALGIAANDVDLNKGDLSADRYVDVCAEISRRFPRLRTIAITLRGSLSASHNTWSAVLWHEGRLYFAPTYDIFPVVDRVGSGDAFAAGIIYSLGVLGWEPQRALEFALAASCLKHSIFGDINLVDRAEVEALASGNTGGRVSR